MTSYIRVVSGSLWISSLLFGQEIAGRWTGVADTTDEAGTKRQERQTLEIRNEEGKLAGTLVNRSGDGGLTLQVQQDGAKVNIYGFLNFEGGEHLRWKFELKDGKLVGSFSALHDSPKKWIYDRVGAMTVTRGGGGATAPTPALGAFTSSDDIGNPPLKGSAEFDAATREYKVTGSGSDIWGRADQFHFLWREMSGNFALTATAKFLTEGNPHRKAVIMLRKSLDTDSPFLHLAIHGDGMAAVQFRKTKGDTTNTVDFPVEGAGVWKLKLVREGSNVTVWAGKEGAPLRELGQTPSQLGSPVLVGLGVSSHTVEAKNTVLFSDVSVEPLPAPRAQKQ